VALRGVSMKLLISMMCLAATALAAQPAPSPKSPGMADQTELTSQSFVTQAQMAGMFEVESGALAQSQGVDAQVKAFGHRMVTEHAAMNTQLLQVVGASMPMPRKLDAEHQARLDKLKSLQGQAFDTAYSDEMMKGHEKAIDLFTKAGTSLRVSTELQLFARNALPALQQHQMLAMALPGSAH